MKRDCKTMKNKNEESKKQTEWQWFQSKFGKFAYIVFPLSHLIGFGLIIYVVYKVVNFFV